MAEPLLELRGVDVHFGQLQVLFGLDLVVQRGEVLALLGTNGAGKSTVLRAVAGLVATTGGTVHFEGKDVTGSDPLAMVQRGVSLVEGGRAVFPDLTVSDNLRLGAYSLRGSPALVQERMDAAIGEFPVLRPKLGQVAGSLSGGEQQMLGLAKALLLDPTLLLVDELSLGLAPTVVGPLLDKVSALGAAGTTIVLVEQSLNVAQSLCERAVFLEKGEVRFEGSPRELLERDDIARAVFLGGTGAAT